MKSITIVSTDIESPLARDINEYLKAYFPEITIGGITYNILDETVKLGGVVLAEKFVPPDEFHLIARRLSQEGAIVFALSETKSYIPSSFGGCVNTTRLTGVIYRDPKATFNGLTGDGIQPANVLLKWYTK